MGLSIFSIVNTPVSSNCYIVSDDRKNSIIIDPGSENCIEIQRFIDNHDLNPQYIFLTHEHFDHIWSVKTILSTYKGVKLLCSKICSNNIQCKKKNYSVFYNGVGFELPPADVLINEQIEKMSWHKYIIEFVITPGHSNGSMCIYIKDLNVLLTGDTMIHKQKTVTKLKGGNEKELNLSMKLLYSLYSNKNPLLLCGHGKSVTLFEYLKFTNI